MSGRGDVAIVGMAALFPGAPDLATYWRNLCEGFDAITQLPAARQDPVFYDPASKRLDRFYCRRGGVVDAHATFDAVRFGVMPVQAAASEPDQLLTLQVAAAALEDAGLHEKAFARARTAVILGRGNYGGPGRTRLLSHVRTTEELLRNLRRLVPSATEAELARVRDELQAELHAATADAAIGLVPNLTASRIANRLDLQGPAYTVDAACASSLVALDQAVTELASGRCDVALAGGVHLCHDEAFYAVFCQLGALSRSERIRPFHAEADGLLVGEGVGVVVLKRLADAERDGDRIWAVVRGVGVASDGREASLMTPRVEGQLLALERAWHEAGLSPTTVGLLEAHGTGTPTGDAAELETVRRFFGPPREGEPRGLLGSVKSNIGHAMPAAGVAGLIKAALALHHGLVPPTLHAERPHGGIAATRYALADRLQEFPALEGPRRAVVNAFGFGGINAHVVLEAHRSATTTRPARPSAAEEAPTEVLLRLAAASPAQLLAKLAAGQEGGDGPCRLALLDPTPERRARARVVLEKGRPWTGREGIWFSPRGLLTDGGTLAFLFPGVDASFEPHVEDVARHFGLPLPPRAPAGAGLEELGVAIVGVNRLVHEALRRLGLQPTFVAGHSIGEWSGMIATGMLPAAAVDGFIERIRPGSLQVPGVVFAAAGCSAPIAEAALEGLPELQLSHDNCPHQVLLCGREASVDAALGRLRARGVLCQKLPFQSGFHSALFAPYLEPHRQNFASLPLQPAARPLWSATTLAPYPDAPEEIRALALRHLVEPVRFRGLVERLWQEGARVFVQVGTGSLVGFVEDTLRGRPHLAWSANVPQRAGLAQLRRLAAALWVEGAEVAFEALERAGATPRSRPQPLQLGVPLAVAKTPLSVGPALLPEKTGRRVVDELQRGLQAVQAAQQEVALAFARGPVAPPPRTEAVTVRELSVERHPELLDHTFFRQPAAWPNVADRHPVVPMTTLLEWMLQAARELCPGRVAIGLSDLRAKTWLAVGTPLQVTLRARVVAPDRVAVVIDGYAEGTILLADAFPAAAPFAALALPDGAPSPVQADALYRDRWMFHGPAFQAVRSIDEVNERAIRGTLVAGPAQGALLDNAGQLFGLLVMLRVDRDRMAMPVRLGEVELFAPHPAPGTPVTCVVQLRKLEAREVVADLELSTAAGPFCRIRGWEDRRFETDDRLWPVMLFPERNLLAEPLAPGVVLLRDVYRGAPTRDQLARRFLIETERQALERQAPRRQRAWLGERIAARDAARGLLGCDEARPLFPVEIALHDEPRLRHAIGPGGRPLQLATATLEELTLALAVFAGEPGVAVAKPSPERLAEAERLFCAAELALVQDEPRPEGLLRLSAAREALLAAAPGATLRATDRSGDELLFGSWRVTTRREGALVVAWTVA